MHVKDARQTFVGVWVRNLLEGREIEVWGGEDRRRIDIGDYYADAGLIRRVLGWEPRVALREGVSRTVAFYREHLQHYL